ncbi:MAG: tetratricopeptide repeat protein [Desulfatiglandaceae bacterium]
MNLKIWIPIMVILLMAGETGGQEETGDPKEVLRQLKNGPQAGSDQQITPEFGQDYWALKKNLAFAQQQAGELVKALNTYKEIIQADQMDPETRLRYAWLLNTRGEHQQAWKVLEPLPIPSDDIRILELQAKTAYWAEKWKAASRLLETYLKRTQQEKSSQ